MQAVINTMRKANPALKLANYTNLVEANPNAKTSSNTYEPSMAVVANDWWLYTASDSLIQWTTSYGTYVVNITNWAPTDSKGRRFPQWMADHQASRFSGLSGLDYIYTDNAWYTPRPRTGSADWKRNGTNIANSTAEIQAAHRKGTADYWAALRAKMPDKKVIGNADNDLSFPEFKGKLNGSLQECGFGKSWSLESRDWNLMMTQYRNMLANTAEPKDVVLQGCGPDGLNLSLLRYGLASAMLENGWFAYTITGVTEPYWADEYSAKIGTPAEAPPTAPTASGIWMRKYTNGMVLVNPGTTTASVSVGSGYKRLLGTQDPVTNNGLAANMVTLLPRTGLLLLKQ